MSKKGSCDRGQGLGMRGEVVDGLILFLFLEFFRMRNRMRMSGSRLSSDTSPRLRSGTGYLGKNDGLGSARQLASAARAAPLQSYNPIIL